MNFSKLQIGPAARESGVSPVVLVAIFTLALSLFVLVGTVLSPRSAYADPQCCSDCTKEREARIAEYEAEVERREAQRDAEQDSIDSGELNNDDATETHRGDLEQAEYMRDYYQGKIDSLNKDIKKLKAELEDECDCELVIACLTAAEVGDDLYIPPFAFFPVGMGLEVAVDFLEPALPTITVETGIPAYSLPNTDVVTSQNLAPTTSETELIIVVVTRTEPVSTMPETEPVSTSTETEPVLVPETESEVPVEIERVSVPRFETRVLVEIEPVSISTETEPVIESPSRIGSFTGYEIEFSTRVAQ